LKLLPNFCPHELRGRATQWPCWFARCDDGSGRC
jgi:hypothetical protein